MILFTAVLFAGLFYSSSTPLEYNRPLMNIAAFARLYGYVRYFHPSDEAAGTDWNTFVIKGVKEVEKAASTQELKKVLQRLFLPIAPSLVIYSKGETSVFNGMNLTSPGQNGIKPVSWQHYGLKSNENSPLFNSIRINRISSGDTGGFANLMGKIDAPPYRNRRFIFKAAVKVIAGEARLWFRVDREYGVRGFYIDNENRPVLPGDWQMVEISGRIDHDAYMLNMGLLVSGKGKAFLDDVQLLMEDQGKFTAVNIRNPGFETDEPGKKPKFWLPQLKDFQCTVSAEQAFSGKQSAVIENTVMTGPRRLFDPVLKAGEYIRKGLGAGLFCVMPLVVYSKDGHTFPKGSGNEQPFESAVSKGKDTVRIQRLAAIIMGWNVLRHFYPNWDLMTADWNKLLIRGLHDANKSQDAWSFLCALRRMTAALNDGQAQVYHPVVKTRAGFGFAVEWIENRVVITASKDKDFRRGDIVVAVDGIDAKLLMAREKVLQSGSDHWKRVRALATFGWGLKGSSAIITIRRRGRTFDVSAIRKQSSPVREFYRPPIYVIGQNRKGNPKHELYYVNLSKLWEGEFEKWLGRLTAADGIIFDAREPVSIENRFIFAHLSSQSVQTPLFMVPRILYPGGHLVRFRDRHWKVLPKSPMVKGKVVFLADHHTVSGAEVLTAMALKHHTGTIIGTNTAGAAGNINTMELPGNYRLIWTGMRVIHSDGSAQFMQGIKPHIRMERSIQGVRQGEDELLKRAMSFLNPK